MSPSSIIFIGHCGIKRPCLFSDVRPLLFSGSCDYHDHFHHHHHHHHHHHFPSTISCIRPRFITTIVIISNAYFLFLLTLTKNSLFIYALDMFSFYDQDNIVYLSFIPTLSSFTQSDDITHLLKLFILL